jgi:hypothetical protein
MIQVEEDVADMVYAGGNEMPLTHPPLDELNSVEIDQFVAILRNLYDGE